MQSIRNIVLGDSLNFNQERVPESRPDHAFYHKPLQNPTASCWFSNKPLGHHTLTTTIAHLCKEAGITGFKTNHSLRATTATRLYQLGVDEQLVMERTGHRNLDGVRHYKRTSDKQQEALSDILNSKRPCRSTNTSATTLNASQHLLLLPKHRPSVVTLRICNYHLLPQ